MIRWSVRAKVGAHSLDERGEGDHNRRESGAFGFTQLALGERDDAVTHAAEDEAVKRQHREPVQPAAQALGDKHGALGVLGALWIGLDAEFEPSLAGESHLGAQAHKPTRIHLLDPPEVDGVADP